MEIKKYIVILFCMAFIKNAFALDNYKVVKIDLGGNSSIAFDLNNNGVVVGKATNPLYNTHAFLYFDESVTDLGTLGGTESEALAVNNLNQVVGNARNLSNQQHAFLYENGVMQDLGTLGGTISSATGINDSSQISGISTINSLSIYRTFLYQTNTGLVDLEISDSIYSSDSLANDINFYGDIVGALRRFSVVDIGFLYRDGSITFVNNLIKISCINDNGIFVGNNSNGKSYISDGTVFTEITSLPFNSIFNSKDINNKGFIVGQASSGGRGTAYIISPDGISTDLNSLVVNNSEFDELTSATAINEKGWISGYGRVGFSSYAFVLIPVTNDCDKSNNCKNTGSGSLSLFSLIFIFSLFISINIFFIKSNKENKANH